MRPGGGGEGAAAAVHQRLFARPSSLDGFAALEQFLRLTADSSAAAPSASEGRAAAAAAAAAARAPPPAALVLLETLAASSAPRLPPLRGQPAKSVAAAAAAAKGAAKGREAAAAAAAYPYPPHLGSGPAAELGLNPRDSAWRPTGRPAGRAAGTPGLGPQPQPLAMIEEEEEEEEGGPGAKGRPASASAKGKGPPAASWQGRLKAWVRRQLAGSKGAAAGAGARKKALRPPPLLRGPGLSFDGRPAPPPEPPAASGAPAEGVLPQASSSSSSGGGGGGRVAPPPVIGPLQLPDPKALSDSGDPSVRYGLRVLFDPPDAFLPPGPDLPGPRPFPAAAAAAAAPSFPLPTPPLEVPLRAGLRPEDAWQGEPYSAAVTPGSVPLLRPKRNSPFSS